MLRTIFSLSGKTRPGTYALVAPLLVAAQYAYAYLAFGNPAHFFYPTPVSAAAYLHWLFPMRPLATLSAGDTDAVFLGFFVCLAASTLLCVLSFRRANWAGRGHAAALFAMVPTVQLFVVPILALMPRAAPGTPGEAGGDGWSRRRQTVIGLLVGMAIIVAAVVVSALTFGAYGNGLFVLTPLLVGVTTGYAVNHGQPRRLSETLGLVALAGMLGTLALLMLALEGLACIMVVMPLAAGMAALGGALGRAAAFGIRGHRLPALGLAALPLVFALEGAMPPALPIASARSITIAAPADAVWNALTDDTPIAPGPGIVGLAGFAYPIAGHLEGEGIGQRRTGRFSTGIADERVTAWQPGRLLAFRVVAQPPAMEEMSPYRRVHAPHVHGYFDTGETRFRLAPLPGGRTRLTVEADHILRINPVPYWGPIARWAIAQNLDRVLADVRIKAEAHRPPPVLALAASNQGSRRAGLSHASTRTP